MKSIRILIALNIGVIIKVKKDGEHLNSEPRRYKVYLPKVHFMLLDGDLVDWYVNDVQYSQIHREAQRKGH